MRTIARLDATSHPPVLHLSIFNAPHRRMHVAVIQAYRRELLEACETAGIAVPIATPIDLSVVFVDPTSPDLGNLYLALEQALDGNTLTAPGVLVDDSLVHKVSFGR